MRTLYIIPARAGSKRLPGKNIRKLAGKRLIYYTIDIARKLIDDKYICVSTDSTEIIKIVEDYGLKVPFKRPAELAEDSSGSYEVLLHALEYYEKQGEYFDNIVLLQPTSPFRKAEHIRQAMNLYSEDIDMVVSVVESNANPYYSLFEENTVGFLEKSKPGNYVREQDCPQVYRYNGSIYIMNVKSLKHKSIVEFKKVRKFLMDDVFSVDIDTKLDWKFCEFLLQEGIVNNGK